MTPIMTTTTVMTTTSKTTIMTITTVMTTTFSAWALSLSPSCLPTLSAIVRPSARTCSNWRGALFRMVLNGWCPEKPLFVKINIRANSFTFNIHSGFSGLDFSLVYCRTIPRLKLHSQFVESSRSSVANFSNGKTQGKPEFWPLSWDEPPLRRAPPQQRPGLRVLLQQGGQASLLWSRLMLMRSKKDSG